MKYCNDGKKRAVYRSKEEGDKNWRQRVAAFSLSTTRWRGGGQVVNRSGLRNRERAGKAGGLFNSNLITGSLLLNVIQITKQGFISTS